MTQDELPLAVRRTRRSLPGSSNTEQAGAGVPPSSKTPRKRVRFSEPGLASTGLTPMVRRAALRTPSARRRHSAPTEATAGNGISQTGSPLPHSGEVHFLPLRQVLDGRIQRRIRRNGMSEEMNSINEEKRRQAREARIEIDCLKAQVAERDDEIYRLRNETIIIDTDRIWELERQIQDLQRELADRSALQERSRTYDWTMAARDPYAPDDMDTTVDVFSDETMAELVCSTPSRARRSFPSPPLTSPTMPLTPASQLATPRSHVGVQACLDDPETARHEEEMASLQLEICKITTTLESHASLFTRLLGRMSAFQTTEATEDGAEGTDAHPATHDVVEAEVGRLVQLLSDRTAALLDLTSSLADLGFPGGDASEIVSSLASGFRTARLELEYLTPGEIALPLSSHGAEVLDLLLTRLRDLAKKAREDDAAIDEYHEIEVSLRQQLGARVSAMDGLTTELTRAQELLREKDATVQELEVSVNRLKGAVNGYIRDVAELESWVERMETETREATASHQAQLQEKEQGVLARDGSIAELEKKLAAMASETDALRRQVDDAHGVKSTEIAALNRKHGAALALRDARVLELRGEIDRVNEALRNAHETIRKLRVENSGLETKMGDERRKAKAVIDSMKEELQRMVRLSQDFLETPKKAVQGGARASSAGGREKDREREGDRDSGIGLGVERVVPSSPLAPGTVVKKGGLLAGDLAKKGMGKKRRRYDSGLGFLDDEEVDMV